MLNYDVIKDCDEEFRTWKAPRERTVGVSPRRVNARLSLLSRWAEGFALGPHVGAALRRRAWLSLMSGAYAQYEWYRGFCPSHAVMRRFLFLYRFFGGVQNGTQYS